MDGNHQIYTQWPASGRHFQDLSKIAKENIAFTINNYTYSDFLNKRNEISLEISKKIAKEFSESYYTDVNLVKLLISS